MGKTFFSIKLSVVHKNEFFLSYFFLCFDVKGKLFRTDWKHVYGTINAFSFLASSFEKIMRNSIECNNHGRTISVSYRTIIGICSHGYSIIFISISDIFSRDTEDEKNLGLLSFLSVLLIFIKPLPHFWEYTWRIFEGVEKSMKIEAQNLR